MTTIDITIAVVGGTGQLGNALARRWAKAGYQVILGSRDSARAHQRAAEMASELGASIRGDSNLGAATSADLVVLAVPFASQSTTLDEIAPALTGKILLDTTVPLQPPRVMRACMPAEGCAALRAQQQLGEQVRVVSAFHNVAAHKLATDQDLECDVLVFSDDAQARSQVVALANAAGLRGLHAGALANSVAAEALTSVLIFMNKHYGVDGAGIRITGSLDLSRIP